MGRPNSERDKVKQALVVIRIYGEASALKAAARRLRRQADEFEASAESICEQVAKQEQVLREAGMFEGVTTLLRT